MLARKLAALFRCSKSVTIKVAVHAPIKTPKEGKAGNLENPSRWATIVPSSLHLPHCPVEVPGNSCGSLLAKRSSGQMPPITSSAGEADEGTRSDPSLETSMAVINLFPLNGDRGSA